MATAKRRRIDVPYNFFNPNLQKQNYEIGDIYTPGLVAAAQAEWGKDVETERMLYSGVNGPYLYLQRVKALSATWPHLRLLADFMEITTTTQKWTSFLKGTRSTDERKRRAIRTTITVLDYTTGGIEAKEIRKNDPSHLRRTLEEGPNPNCRFRLYVVEDLSRYVIELLGTHLQIEPSFFRDHIVDYAWYNVRDRWIEPGRLNIVAKRQRWLQLRYPTARYFKTTQEWNDGLKQAENFNVGRRPEDDANNNSMWDSKGAIVGIIRTKAIFWLKSMEEGTAGAVGVLLLDPTIQAGVPLWYGYRDWRETPPPGQEDAMSHPDRKSTFEDYVYWAQQRSAFKFAGATGNLQHEGKPHDDLHIPIQALLMLVCSEWLTIAEYIRTRLGQIEWEISYPEHFLNNKRKVDDALKKLHVWRRLVPLYREMLSDTLEKVFGFPCHTERFNGSARGVSGPATAASATAVGEAGVHRSGGPANSRAGNQSNGTGLCPAMPHVHTTTADDIAGNKTPPTSIPSSTTSNDTSATRAASTCCTCRTGPPPPATSPPGPITALADDFRSVLSKMEEYQARIDRLTSVVTAIISIDDSRLTRDDNRNVARLTWLATFFIPLSFVCGLFSMQAELSTLVETIRFYFKIAIPVSVFALGVAFVLGSDHVREWIATGWGRVKGSVRSLWQTT